MKKTSGYALLEVVICLAFAMIFAVSISAAFESASRMNAIARKKLQDEIVVQNAAEIALAKGYPAAREDILNADNLPLDDPDKIQVITVETDETDEASYYKIIISKTFSLKENGSIIKTYRTEITVKARKTD